MGVGSEFIAKAGRDEIEAEEAKTLFMEQGRPGERDHCESFDLKFRDELLNDEIFPSLAEARVMVEAWRVTYSTIRPHSFLGDLPPAPEALHWAPKQEMSSPRRRLPWHRGPSCTKT